MEKALRLIDVNKSYKVTKQEKFQALYDINVEFDKGELVSIVGESGSGKSTLMNLIGGLDSDFTGTIIAGGEDLGKLSDKQLDKYRKDKVGFVFQSFNLISHLSILDNVTLALTLSNIPEKEKVERATEMLKRVGLETQLKKNPTQLSGGQKQRVAIARALINDPEIIIADEPTGALDSETSMQILEILKEIADSGKLVIMVTHSERVASISSRVVKISDGRIVGDELNKNYKKSKKLEVPKEEKKKSEKQNLSFFSAIRLSLHNMWASKVKNFLMAFGVAIGIGSLIMMLCFSSGINDFIDTTMLSYSNPEIVTITKKGSGGPMSLLQYNEFSDEDKTNLVNDINAYLTEKNNDFRVDDSNLSAGAQLMTMVPEGTWVFENKDDVWLTDTSSANALKAELESNHIKYSQLFYIYSIPPYYSDTNVFEGKMCTSEGGVMLTKGAKMLFDDGQIVGKKINLSLGATGIPFKYFEDGTPFTNDPTQTYDFEVTGVMDTSIMANYLVMYVDYNYFQKIYQDAYPSQPLNPNTLYIKTDSKETTDLINAYLAESGEYRGSIEDSLAGLFSSLSSTIGTSLTVISCISLLVSAMMILVVLYMSVSERTKEIGVMKSIDARRKDIKLIFTSESFLIGILSGIVGVIFNLIMTLIITLTLKNTIGLAPLSYRWWYFALAIGVSVFISMLSGLYPASKAAKLDPVESLRRE